MNPDMEIYRAIADEIPGEDTARLDGYLAAKAEQGDVSRLQREFEAKIAEIDRPALLETRALLGDGA